MDSAPAAGKSSSRAHRRQPCLVVGYDGSPEAHAAVAYAAGRAGKSGQVVVVHTPEPGLTLPGVGDPSDDPAAHAAAVLDALVLEGADELIDTRYELELGEGSPAEALMEAAATHGADEIIVGSRGFGRVRSALGSVSREVVQRADRPVVVVPHGALDEG